LGTDGSPSVMSIIIFLELLLKDMASVC
jgi:hypothetical protein